MNYLLANNNANDKIIEQYWVGRLMDSDVLSGFPVVGRYSLAFEGGTYNISEQLTPALTLRLTEMCKNSESAIQTLAHTAFQLVLFRYSGNNNPVIAYNDPGSKGLYFSKIKIADDATLFDVLQSERLSIAESNKYIITHTDILAAIALKLNKTPNNITKLLFHFGKGENKLYNYFPFRFGFLYKDQHTAELTISYNAGSFNEQFVKKILSAYLIVLEALLTNARQAVSALEIMTADEKKRILETFNDTAKSFRSETLIHTLFSEKVPGRKNDFAICTGSEKITYGELHQRSNQVAHFLLKRGLQKGDFVPVLIGRRPEMIILLLGILKSSGVYVPVDPALPESRITEIIRSFAASFMFTEDRYLDKVYSIVGNTPGLDKILTVDSIAFNNETPADERISFFSSYDLNAEAASDPSVQMTSRDLAYVIFTSGTTGIPKGVMVNHQSVVNLIEWVNTTFNVSHDDKMLFVTSYCFDLSVYDIFGILAAGGTIRIVDETDIHEPARLLDIIVDEKITFWDSAPGFMQQLIPFLKTLEDRDTELRLIFLSGDWIPVNFPGLLKSAFKNASFVSLGGATEATVWSNYFIVETADPHWVSIPYGKPIQNARYYILDRHMNPCPVDVPGELYIGDFCIAQGYLNRPEENEARFVYNPFLNGQLFYRTGDMARWINDGNIEFLGRTDSQVKIRGYRVELSDIEHNILKYGIISETVVITRKIADNDAQLLAFYTSDKAIDPEDLRAYLKDELPAYMLPHFLFQVDKVPINSNGKIDRKSLEGFAEKKQAGHAMIKMPANETEHKLLEIFKEVLRSEEIDVEDNFFEIGGTSLMLIKANSLITEEFGIQLPMVEIFRNSNVRLLANYLVEYSGPLSESREEEHVSENTDLEDSIKLFSN